MKSLSVAGIIASLGVIGVMVWLWGFNILHMFTTQYRESTPFWFFAFIGVAAGIVMLFQDRNYGLWFGVMGASLVGLLLFTIPADYNRLNAYYNASVEIVEGDAADYDDRAPYEVARAVASKYMGDTIGETLNTKALVDEGEYGEWNTLSIRKGIFVGYENVQNANVPLYGAVNVNAVKFCEFDDNASLRHGGSMPHNNLSRAIFGSVPLNVDFDSSDAYGYCNDDNEPVVVTPLKQVNGFFYPLWSFYGVAVYNGATGDLDIVTDVDKVNEIPGAVYPASLAAVQRHSLVAGGSWSEYFFNSFGWETATENSEVNLRSADGESMYVTTLRPRGSSFSIVAVAEVAGGSVVDGKFNPLVVNKLPESRPANKALVSDIRSQYSYMPEMANDSAQVFEITSGKDGGWVASIGLEESVNYRAYIDTKQNIELFDRNGNLIATGSTSNPTPENPDGEVVLVPENGISELSTEELKTLGNQIMDELVSRATPEG